MKVEKPALALDAIEGRVPLDSLAHVGDGAHDERVEVTPDVAFPARHGREVGLHRGVAVGSRSGGCRLRGGPASWPPRGPCSWLRWIVCLYQPPLLSLAAAGFPFLEGFDLPELLRATAWRTSAVNADSSTSSPSRMSIARRTFPSRLELKRRAGSFRDAPLAKVSLTTFL